MALYAAGEVLYYSPADEDGLWINRAIAEVLNGKESERMRRGYSIKTFNSRGVYSVDPTGVQERALAEKYRTRGDALVGAGFHRFAETLFQLAERYDREAENVSTRKREE